MKKVLSVLIAVAMLAAVCSMGINASSYPIVCTGDFSYPAWARGGSVYDYSSGKIQANAWASNTSTYNSVELDGGSYGEWFDHGQCRGEMADVYSSVIQISGTKTARDYADQFTYYSWGNSAR